VKRTTSVIAAFGAVLALGAPRTQAQEPPSAPAQPPKPPVAAPVLVLPQSPAPQGQTPPAAAPQAPAPGQSLEAQPAPAPTAASQVQALSREKIERIYHIRQLEAMLTNAVKAGANSLASELQAEPNTLFVTNSARARGHELEDYGVFFDVDVPTILPSALWAVQMRQSQLQDLYTLRDAVDDPKTSESVRRVARMELRRLERVLGLPPSQQAIATDAAQPAARGYAVAATTDASPAPGSPEVAPVPQLDPRDPNELYTEAIKNKLIDAMLSYGSALRLEDGEWLTIAARSSDVPPGQLDDAASILLRIKGADLNAYVLKKISRDDVIKKIEIKIG
jgi:hypothetical protein